MVNQDFDLQVIIVSGMKQVERVIIGLATALSAAVADHQVVVFLTMEGAAFANPEEGKLRYIEKFESVQKYFDLLIEEGAHIEVCSACVENYCLTEKLNGVKLINPNMNLAGLSTAAIRAAQVKTIVF